ncbi:hypothetical protein Tco_1156861 [Tanacetum coccineum]
MNPIAAQQVALNNALVAPKNRVHIGKCNMKIYPTKTQKEPTYQVVLDSLALSPFYPAFLITAEVPKIYMHQFWHTITKIKNSSSFKFKLDKKKCTIDVEELGHKGDIKSITKVVVDQMHQPWRTFATIINRCLSVKTSDFVFQIDNSDVKKQEKMYYPRFTKAIIHFISKDKSISMRNRTFMHTVRDESILGSLRFVSKSYEYQVYGALLPEGMTNRKMRDSPAYKTYLSFTTGAATPNKARKFKKPASPSKKKALVAKKASAKAERSKGIELLSEAALLEEAQLRKAIKRSKQETNIHQAGGSKSDDDKSADLNKTDDKEEDKFVHTPDDYVPTDDENVDDEEYERINKEIYDDVNVELKDAELDNEEKGDEEMTYDKNVNAEHKQVSQEVAGDQVKDGAQATGTATLATQKTEVPLQSSSISSDYATKFLNFDNIPSGEMEIISMMDIKVQHEDPSIQTSPLLTVPIKVIPETSTTPATTIPLLIPPFIPFQQQSTPIPTPTTTEATTSTTVVHDSETLSAIHRRVSDLENEVKELKKSQTQVKPQKSAEDIRKVKMEHAAKQQESQYTIKSSDKAALKEFFQKRALFETMTASKTFNKHPKYKALYHALMESILADEDAIDKGIADIQKKRKPDDPDKDEDHLARPDQGLRRRNLREDTGNTDEPPIVNVDPKGWFKKPERPPTPDPKWNEGKTVDNKPAHKWLSDLAKAETSSKTFDDLMSTLIDFSAFDMNRLQISDLTQDILVGPAYKLLKVDYFFNNDLAYLQGESTGKTYMTSFTKIKAAKYDLPGIEDIVPNLWSLIKVAYDKHVFLGNGPNWLFDVDSLKISMNYVPVAAGNQTNGIAGTRDNIVAGQAEKKTKSEQEYILIPFCKTDPLISQGPKDSEKDVGIKPTEVNENGASDKGEEDEQDTRSEFERLLQQEKQTNSTNSFNTVGTPVSAAGPSFTNDDPSSPVNAAEASNAFEDHLFERFSPFKNAFALPHVPNVFSIDDTRIFGNAYDDEDTWVQKLTSTTWKQP